MDDRYPRSGLPTPSGNQYSQSLAPQQFNNGPQPPHHHTLPPLTGNTGQYPIYGHGSNQQGTLASQSSTTSASTSGTVIPSIQSHVSLRPLQPSPSYSLPNTSFASSQAPLHPTAHTSTHLQDFRTGGNGGLMQQPQLYHPQMIQNQQEDPVHVVGQQGRRGVLPTIPGRPPPTTGKAPANPTKNADNKYECPHCIKTYLHLKHLKRHLLRHTGERPYQCHLCKDTFSRSDILKRHFQKCSIRRGNPTGASHLTHAQNHLQKNRLSANGSDANSYLGHIPSSMSYSNADAYGNPLVGMAPISSESTAYNNEAFRSLSARTSRSNSVIRPATGVEEHRRSMSGLDFATGRPNFEGSDYRNSNLSHGMTSYASQQIQPSTQVSSSTNHYGYEPSMGNSELAQNIPIKTEPNGGTSYGRPSLPNVDGLNGTHENGLRWNGTFQTDPQDNYLMQSSMTSSDAAHGGMFGGLYGGGAGFVDATPMLGWSLNHSDPLQSKAEELISYCYPEHSSLNPASSDAHGLQSLKNLLTAENLKHFLEGYQNFHAHWPMLHIPTFDPANTNNGLLLVIVCIGAVYSDKLTLPQVRWLMELAKASVQRSSQLYKTVIQSSTYSPSSENISSDIEEVTALCLLQTLFIWHGNQTQRQEGRDNYWVLVRIARYLDLATPLRKGQHGFSILHQPGNLNPSDVSEWQWDAWIEQEKRIRTFYIIFLLDAALGIFFNCAPQFDLSEVKIPLPADDAAWDARTAEECAAALGLQGEMAQGRNTTGSKRAKQMGLWEAVQSLHKNVQYQPRSTNAYGKFIVIHALHYQILQIHRQAQLNGLVKNEAPSDGSNNGDNTSPSHAISGQYTLFQQRSQSVRFALDHWKQAWELDQQLQYPPSQRRAGYCRDAVHYYFLAKMFLSQKREDWETSGDLRRRQVFSLMRRIKAYVASEQEKNGLDIGSISDVSDNYGMEELTLDMKLLFAPVTDSMG